MWPIIGLLAFAYFYFYMVKPYRYWKDRGVPQQDVTKLLYTRFVKTVRPKSLTTSMENMYRAFPNRRYGGMYHFDKPTLMIKDPDLIKQITVKDFDHFVDHIQSIPDEPIWEKNLFALRGDKWRDMRATLSPSFTSSKMRMLFGLVSDCAKQFIQHFHDRNQDTVDVEMKDCFSRFTNDVIANTAFGVTCNSLKDRQNEFYVMGRNLTDFSGASTVFKFAVIFNLPLIANVLGLKVFSTKIYNFFKGLVTENIRTREREGIVRPDMIHLLMEAKKGREKSVLEQNPIVDEGFAIADYDSKSPKRQKAQLTEEDIMAQAMIFFFAGFDTVSSQMCFLAYELALNPDVQKRLQNEVDATLEECGGSVTYEVLLKMKYMDMVISESMRKWPAIVINDRVCVEPFTIQPTKPDEKPVHLEKNVRIWIPVFGIHRAPEYYPNPDRFDPERFSDENKSKIAPFTYMPFGNGPRTCIGSRFALMEIKLLIFHILSEFDVVVVEKTPIPLKLANNPAQLTAEGGFWLGFKRRG